MNKVAGTSEHKSFSAFFHGFFTALTQIHEATNIPMKHKSDWNEPTRVRS